VKRGRNPSETKFGGSHEKKIAMHFEITFEEESTPQWGCQMESVNTQGNLCGVRKGQDLLPGRITNGWPKRKRRKKRFFRTTCESVKGKKKNRNEEKLKTVKDGAIWRGYSKKTAVIRAYIP